MISAIVFAVTIGALILLLAILLYRWMGGEDSYLGHAVDCRCVDCRLVREIRRERAP